MSFYYCVIYNGYIDNQCFYVEKVFYGDSVKRKAIEHALKLNIEYLEKICEDYEDRRII